jgi:glucosylceramidase
MSEQPWESCIFNPDRAHDFIKNYMGPTLWRNNMKDKNLIAWDHNRDFTYHYVAAMLNDPETAKYIWGTGVHWYDRGRYDNVAQVNKAFPGKKLAFTEGCVEGYKIERINEVSLGEHYAVNILNDLNSGVVLWTDWNILLDEKGGPNHVGNVCFAPLHGITATGDLVYTPAYTYIGHFSKFILPGARRIVASSNRRDLQTTAFINPDGKKVVVVLNTSDNTLPYSLFIGEQEAKSESNPHSIATWIF